MKIYFVSHVCYAMILELEVCMFYSLTENYRISHVPTAEYHCKSQV